MCTEVGCSVGEASFWPIIQQVQLCWNEAELTAATSIIHDALLGPIKTKEYSFSFTQMEKQSKIPVYC